MMVDGGLLIVASYSGNKRFPLQLQIKEVDELDSSVLFHGKNQVVGGIEVNSFNKPVAYHFTVYDTFGETGRTVRIPADRVIYLNKIKRTSQVREISGFSNVLSRLRDLNQFLNIFATQILTRSPLAAICPCLKASNYLRFTKICFSIQDLMLPPEA